MRAAIRAARQAIEGGLQNGAPPQSALRQAFAQATDALAVTARELGFNKKDHDPQTFGLRTTLIALVIRQDTIWLGYIGDGCAFTVDREGSFQSLLSPQRLEGKQNVLAASLGPTMRGGPEFVSVPRKRGEYVFAGTDGIADRVSSLAELGQLLIQQIDDQGGDTKMVLDQFLDQCARQGGPGNYDFDDNLSLGVAVDRRFHREASPAQQANHSRFQLS